MSNCNQKGKNILQTHDVLKTIYFVVAGLSIVESLVIFRNIFSPLKDDKIIIFALFIAFLVTIVRFCQGVSRVLAEERAYAIFDFYGFFLQGIGFYFMAININNVEKFIYSFLFMLIMDSIWLIFILCNNEFMFTKVERQWLHSNVVIIVLIISILLLSIFLQLDATFAAPIVLLIAVVAAYFDERKNKYYYLGKSAGEGTGFLVRPYFNNLIVFFFKG